MDVLKEVFVELGKMFFGDPRLAIPLLALIAAAAATATYVSAQGAGALLVVGCVALLAENVFHVARKSRR
jgi:hypothetical protein